MAGSYTFLKRLGGRQRAVRAIDMRAEMTRSTEGGSETPCTGYEPYPTMRCLGGTSTEVRTVAVTVPKFR